MGTIRNDPTWQHVQELVDRVRNEIVATVKAMLVKVEHDRGPELDNICRKYHCKMWLLLDEDGANPFLIRPLMYIAFSEGVTPDTMELWHTMLNELEWASQLRITMKMIEKPYEGEALYTYPR
jgi:hypothetical protein